MKSCKIIFAIFLLSLALHLGCGSNGASVGMAANSTPESADSQRRESGGVVRQTPPQPAQAVLGEPKVIATRRGPDGLEVDLIHIGFTGDLMTVELRYRNPTNEPIHVSSYQAEDVSFIDDATSRRYSVVKDQSGKYMASPLSVGLIGIGRVKEKGYSIVWFKFPAPPPSTQTISITIPNISPFDGIRIQR